MLIPFERLLGTPVMSLQTGAELARTKRILVDPRELMIVAYELDGAMLVTKPSFLRPADVRELSSLGLIVDSSDEFVELEDVIIIQQVYEFEFDLIGLDVIDDRNKKLGRISGYNIDSTNFSVEQIVVKRPLMHSFGETELLINRTQIIEVREDHVTVMSSTASQPMTKLRREFANPFRHANTQPEAIETEPYWP